VAVAACGGRGGGSTGLVAEAAARAELPNQFRIVGYEPESEEPLASAAELLRALADATRGGCQLAAFVFDTAGGDGSQLDRLRIFEAAHRALRETGPALVLV